MSATKRRALGRTAWSCIRRVTTTPSSFTTCTGFIRTISEGSRDADSRSAGGLAADILPLANRNRHGNSQRNYFFPISHRESLARAPISSSTLMCPSVDPLPKFLDQREIDRPLKRCARRPNWWQQGAYGECHYGERKADQLLNEMAERGVPIIAAKINRNARDSRTRPRGWRRWRKF